MNDRSDMLGRDFDDLCSSGTVVGPVAAEHIDRAERELGLTFPQEYSEFLRKYGALVANGLELYGLPPIADDGPPMWTDVVSMTLELRRYGQIDESMVWLMPFSEDGMGSYFCMDVRCVAEPDIWAIGPGVQQVVCKGLQRFAFDWLAGRIVL